MWSILAQRVVGDDQFAIGDSPVQLLTALHGGGIVVALMCIGFLWLFMTGFCARGVKLREQNRRIAELEAQLRREP
jgi:hypothetical protein